MKLRFLLIILVFSVISLLSGRDNITLTLNTALEQPFSNEQNTGFYDLLVIEMFERNNVKVHINHVVPERAITNVNIGLDDGNYIRVKGLEKKYENLVMIPEVIGTFEFTAFSKDKTIDMRKWGNLTNLNVGIIKGWKYPENRLKDNNNIIEATDSVNLFQLLINNRVDVVIYNKYQGLYILNQLSEDKSTYHWIDLDIMDMYVYLNSKHKKFVNDLSQSLKKMKSDDTYNRIYNKTLKKLLK